MRTGDSWQGKSRRSRLTALTVIALMVLPALCGACGEPSFSSEEQEKMEKVVTDAMSSENIPGVIVGVWVPGGGTWIEAKGKADIKTGRGIGEEDRVRIASNTKSFTATVVLQLAEEGELSLDDRLDKYIQGVPYGDRITVRQVCNMTSGIFSFTEDEQFNKEFTENPLMEFTPQQGVDIALKHQPYFAPGQGWHYSDTNYEILGIIIEKVTGNKAGEEITRRIIEPLSLENTSFPSTPDIGGSHSKGYVFMEGKGLVDYTRLNSDVPWTGGAVISNLSDMRTWARAAAEGELLSKEMHEQQVDWVDTGEGNSKYGLGIMNIDGFIGHHGAIFGFNSVFFYYPEEDATIVVFTNQSTNSSNEAADIFVGLFEVLFPEKIPKK
jgi:D-alanyl-D-alanine carboxypeptidase